MKVLAILIIGLMLNTIAMADELDELFAQLKTTQSTRSAVTIEEQIWASWLIGPTEADSTAMLGVVKAMQQGELTLALVQLDELIESAPDYAEAWNKRATVNYMLGDFQQSFLDIEQTVKLEPRHFGAWSGMALMFEQLEQIDAAIKAHERVLEIYPASEFTQTRMQELLERQRQDSI